MGQFGYTNQIVTAEAVQPESKDTYMYEETNATTEPLKPTNPFNPFINNNQ